MNLVWMNSWFVDLDELVSGGMNPVFEWYFIVFALWGVAWSCVDCGAVVMGILGFGTERLRPSHLANSTGLYNACELLIV